MIHSRRFNLLVMGALSAALQTGAAAAAAVPPVCGIDPNENYFFSGGFLPSHSLSDLNRNETETIGRPMTGNLRLIVRRLAASEEQGDGTITLQCESCPPPDDAPFRISPDDFDNADESVWSRVFFGAVTVKAGPAAPRVAIDAYAVTGKAQRQLGVIDAGPLTRPNWCKVRDFQGGEAGPPGARTEAGNLVYAPGESNFSAAANSVAAIGFIVGTHQRNNEKQIGLCSGFFVTPTLVITNRHCVCPAEPDNPCPNEPEFTSTNLYEESAWNRANEQQYARSFRVWSRVAAREQSEAPSFQDARLVFAGQAPHSEAPLDYALLELSPLPGLQINPGVLSARKALTPGETLSVPQYPGNYPFSINYDSNCEIFANADGGVEVIRLNANGHPSEYPHALHGCDTGRGSSGSPVFTRDLSEVIGVHNCCWSSNNDVRLGEQGVTDDQRVEGNPGNPNRFILIGRILCDLKERAPDIFKKLEHEGKWSHGGADALQCGA